MNTTRRFLFTLTLFCIVYSGTPLVAGITDPAYFFDRQSFEVATAELEMTTETFQQFPVGTCLDIVCEDPGSVPGIRFTSANASYCDDLPPEECDYFPVQAAEECGEGSSDDNAQPVSVVLGGGFATQFGGQITTETNFDLTFDPAVVAFGFDLLGYFPYVRVEIEFEDGSPPPPPVYVDDSDFFGAVSSKRISQVIVETALIDVEAMGDYALDDLSYNLPPQPPLCERVAIGADGTTLIAGVAQGDPAGGALDPPELITDFPANLELTFDFETAFEVYFYVEFDEALPAAQGVVVVEDQAGGQCSLPFDFQQLAPEPIDGREICLDDQDGIVVQIDNPPPDETGPGTEGGTLACSGQPPDVEAFPPGYEPSPGDDPWPCVEFVIESPVFGSTQMVYKKDGTFDPRLRLLFAKWVSGEFADYVDITLSLEEIAYIIPDPSRMVGKARWSPVRITCALLDPDCAVLPECNVLGDPGCIDDDDDGEPLCLAGQVLDCGDQDARINHMATEICNGLDDNCDGVIDEGFDRDDDGIADCFDNCPDHYNPDQEDSDGDGIGDVCPPDDEGGDEGDDEGDEGDDEWDDYPRFFRRAATLDEAAGLSNQSANPGQGEIPLHHEELEETQSKPGDQASGRSAGRKP